MICYSTVVCDRNSASVLGTETRVEFWWKKYPTLPMYIWNLVVSVSVMVSAESNEQIRVSVWVSDLNQNSGFGRSTEQSIEWIQMVSSDDICSFCLCNFVDSIIVSSTYHSKPFVLAEINSSLVKRKKNWILFVFYFYSKSKKVI